MRSVVIPNKVRTRRIGASIGVAAVITTLAAGCGGGTELFGQEGAGGASDASTDVRADGPDAATGSDVKVDGHADGKAGQGGDGSAGNAGEGGDASVDAGCGPGLSLCGAVCVSLQSDPQNCGDCGVACGAGKVCSGGTCGAVCDPGLTECSGACVSLSTDPNNCGACAAVCNLPDALAGCGVGKCTVASCIAGFGDCNASAQDGCEANFSSDFANCGACGAACTGGLVCSAGNCTTVCAPGLTECSGSCVSLLTDPANCGACGAACGLPNAVAGCTGGKCTVAGCSAGFADCNASVADGCEINAASDALNCGGCGKVCSLANATAVCSASACLVGSCNAGWGDCDGKASTGCEANLSSDPLNCGGCGKACGPSDQCIGGACTLVCQGGQTDCNGACVDLQTDASNCGTCGKACAPNEACISGACSVVCQPGHVNCSGLCVDTASDAFNCGACGRACSGVNVASRTCEGGVCTSSCQLGYGNCAQPAAPNPDDGCEKDVSADDQSCGSCSNSCADQGGGNGLVCDGASRPKNLCGCSSDAACSSGSGSGASCNAASGICSCNGTACRPGEFCRAMMGNTTCSCNGSAHCSANQTCCNSPVGCKDLSNDPASCGACGHSCPAGFACAAGSCACTFNSACNAGSSGTCSNGTCSCGATPCQQGQRCLTGGVCG